MDFQIWVTWFGVMILTNSTEWCVDGGCKMHYFGIDISIFRTSVFESFLGALRYFYIILATHLERSWGPLSALLVLRRNSSIRFRVDTGWLCLAENRFLGSGDTQLFLAGFYWFYIGVIWFYTFLQVFMGFYMLCLLF